MLHTRIVFMCMMAMFITGYIHAQETQTKLPELYTLTGSWKVTTETRLSANGPWETTIGTAVIKKSTGDALIEEEYTGKLRNKSFLTKSLITYNHFSNVFQRAFVDSEHGVIVDYEGQKKSGSVFFDKLWTYANGTTVKLRVVYIIISSNEFKIENMRMPENSTEWDITGRMHYIRSK